MEPMKLKTEFDLAEDDRVALLPALPRKRLSLALADDESAAGRAPAAQGAQSTPRSASRRRKLWEISTRHHCPVIGTCLPMTELRRLARRTKLNEKTTSDYALHAYAVGQAQERSEFSLCIQRELDKRYAPMVATFARLRDSAAILALWREKSAAGEAAAALWAALSHPLCDEPTDREIYGDIHMLSHQVGAGQRADLARLAALQAELSRAQEAAQRDRERAARRLAEMEAQARESAAQLAQARCAASQRDAEFSAMAAKLADFEYAAAAGQQARRRAEVAERRLETLRGDCTGLQRRLDAALVELAELRAEREVGEAALCEITALFAARRAPADSLASCGTQADCSACPDNPAVARLSGRCLLCIGGRENLVGHYRGLVESLGGRFLHHDGGVENSQKRLEATLASADAVVCQASCVSHAAYWKLKEFCKRHNKPCLYLKSSGVTSFAHGLAQLTGQTVGTAPL